MVEQRTSSTIRGEIDPNALAQRFVDVRARTEALAAPLSAEDQMVQSMDDVSPTKWHRAHTTWFFAEFVLDADGAGGRPWDTPAHRFLYNSYYEAVGARHPRPDRGLVTRPSCAEVASYRSAVDDAMAERFAAGLTAAQSATVLLGTHHEEQHQELLLIDIKHVLSCNPAVGPAYVQRASPAAADPGPMSFVEVSGGIVEVGFDDAVVGGAFSFDNERPRHEVRLYDFTVADRLVTSGEWLEFIEDGGYQRPEFWKSDGWHRSQSEGWVAPLYWRRNPDSLDAWWVHTLSGLRDVDPHEPVCHVSHYEAEAYACWAGARLPTEFEWEHAAAVEQTRRGGEPLVGNFLGEISTSTFHPSAAVGPRGTGEIRQLFGDVWEWTSSAYEPYPGFRTAEGAIGEYNGKFMSGQQVLRGGGALTPLGHARTSYRNFFHPQTRWHLGGVRLATTPN